jgi:N-6 DNA Methylase
LSSSARGISSGSWLHIGPATGSNSRSADFVRAASLLRADMIFGKDSGGEFYTPSSVVRVMVEMIEPYKGGQSAPRRKSPRRRDPTLPAIGAANSHRSTIRRTTNSSSHENDQKTFASCAVRVSSDVSNSAQFLLQTGLVFFHGAPTLVHLAQRRGLRQPA